MRSSLRCVLTVAFIFLVLPFLTGAWYSGCGDRYAEQAWLDKAVRHLKVLRLTCRDPEVRDVLDYTIRRYNRIGPWDVMVMPLANPTQKTLARELALLPRRHARSRGAHVPDPRRGLILAHEACHDYFPYFHPYVDPLVKKVESL